MGRLWLDLDSAIAFTGATAEEIVDAFAAGDIRGRKLTGDPRKFDAADLSAKWPAAAQAIGKALGIVKE